MAHPPPDFFVLAVFATFCCFLPTGIIAIAKSTEVSSSGGPVKIYNTLHLTSQGLSIFHMLRLCRLVSFYCYICFSDQESNNGYCLYTMSYDRLILETQF